MTTKIQVRSTKQITEQNFMGKKLHVHARANETGDVIALDPAQLAKGVVTVRFQRTGTATDMVIGEDCELTPSSRALMERTLLKLGA